MGAFTRAHQAVLTEDAIAASGDVWRIIGVSMRSATVRDQLAPQDHLFTVTSKGEGAPVTRLVRCVGDAIVAPDHPERVVAALADPRTRVVTLTVTEKGYHLVPADAALPALLHEDAARATPQTIYGYFAQALEQRRANGLPGLTILSCDNLAENGTRLRDMLLRVLAERDPALAEWCAVHCTFPNSMVDRIVPASQPADLDALEGRIGLRDEAAVFTEPFRQWVIEDSFAGPRPAWDAAGAQIVADVRPYETAKLRMLNGAHSALAYLGLAKGLELVNQAIAADARRGCRQLHPRARAGSGGLCRFADRTLCQPRFAAPARADRDGRVAENPAALAGDARRPAGTGQGVAGDPSGAGGVDRPCPWRQSACQ
jgi:fructuronate reductase